MEPKKFLTDEQRRGLIYGSLISAVLSGGAALRSGGNVTDAIGRGTLGASQAFGGGLEEIAKRRHQEIEEEKIQEAIEASRASTALAKKGQARQEEESQSRMLHEAAQTAELTRATGEKTARGGKHAALLAQIMQEQTAAESGEAPGMPGLSPAMLRALQFSTPENAAAILAGGERAAQTFNIGTAREETRRAMPEITEKAEAPRKAEERKVPVEVAKTAGVSREKVAETRAAATLTAAEKKVEAKEKKFNYVDPKTGKMYEEFQSGFLPYPSKAADKALRYLALQSGEKPKAAGAAPPQKVIRYDKKGNRIP